MIYCDQSKYGIPWRTQFKLVGTYPLPWWGLQFSGSLQALPGYVLHNLVGAVNLPPLYQGSGSATNLNNSLNLPNAAGTVFSVTPSTVYTVCPGDSAAAGCSVGARVIPGMNQASLNVPLIPTGTEMTPRLTQLDFSVGKRFNFERIRFEPRVDLFNALNSSDYFAVRTMVYSTAASYKQPSSILLGRLVRFGAVVNW